MFKIVKCPEGGTLELVECLDTPLGHLIHRCTKFRPVCAMRCTRGCATDLDRSSRAEVGGAPIREREGRLVLDRDAQVQFDLELELELESTIS